MVRNSRDHKWPWVGGTVYDQPDLKQFCNNFHLYKILKKVRDMDEAIIHSFSYSGSSSMWAGAQAFISAVHQHINLHKVFIHNSNSTY